MGTVLCPVAKVDKYVLTDQEKYNARLMCGLVDSNQPFNESFFNNMTKAEIKYLLSIVDRQDAQYSHSYVVYISKLEALARKNGIPVY